MTFARKRLAGQWTTASTVEPAEFEAFDEDLSNALDGASGGTYACTNGLIIGGKGIQDAHAIKYTVPAPVATALAVGGHAHRLVVEGGNLVSTKIIVEFDPDANGTCREFFIDELPAGILIEVKQNLGGTIATHTVTRAATRIHGHLEMIAGAWTLQSLNYHQSLPISSVVSPANPHSVFYEETFIDNEMDLGGATQVFNFPTYAANGAVRHLHFYWVKNTRLSFRTTGNAVPFAEYDLTAQRRARFSLTFRVVGGAWRWVGRTDRPKLNYTLSVGSLPATTDTALYTYVVLSAIPPSGAAETKLTDGLEENQDLYIKVISFQPTGSLTVRNSANVLIKSLILNDAGQPYSTGGHPVNNATAHLKWFNQSWNWMGFYW